MAYTSHGWHITGSPEDEDIPEAKARCGGPGLCGLCSSQQASWQQEAARLGLIASLDAKMKHEGLIRSQTFVSRPSKVEAIRFMGGVGNGMDLEAWVKAMGGNATWQNAADPWTSEDGQMGHSGWPESLKLETPGGWQEVLPGNWIVMGSRNDFYPIPDDVFTEKYEIP